MNNEMNKAAAPPADRLPSAKDDPRKVFILELPRTVVENNKDVTKRTWHVLGVPDSLIQRYEDACKAHSKENQILTIKKRGEHLVPGLYSVENNTENLLAKVIESGEGRLEDQARDALKAKYGEYINEDSVTAQSNAPAPHHNDNNKKDKQEPPSTGDVSGINGPT